jgi:outer membrane autotransporter protein
LNAANHLSGTFTLTGNLTISPFLALDDAYDDNNAYLTVVQTRSLTEAASSANQIAVAEALESTPPGNGALAALLSLPDDEAAADALDQLAGDIHSSLRGGLMAATLPLREAALDRLRAALCVQGPHCEAGATLWSRGYGLAAAQEGLDIRTGGFLFGADLPGPAGTRFGVFGGMGASSFGEAASSDFTLGSYGGAALGNVALRWGAAATAHRVTTERQIVLPGFSETLSAAYPALGMQAFAEAAYRIEAGPMAFEPFANLAYTCLAAAGFTETGGDAALTVEASNSALLLATLGLAVEADLGGGTLRASAGWQHVIAGGTSDAAIAFAGGETRRIGGTGTPADSLVLGLDLDLPLGETARLSLGYDGMLAPGLAQHGVKAELRVAF